MPRGQSALRSAWRAPRVHQAGDTAIAIDDIASIAKEAGDVIMKIYNGTSAEVGRANSGRHSAPLARRAHASHRSLAAASSLALPIALSRATGLEKIADFKADGSPLTAADKMASAVICSALTGYPAIPIISEENVNADYEARKDWEYFWCVDPLDGTKEFIKRNGQFTVNIGLCKGGAPIAGVVYVPAADPPVMCKGALGLGPPVREEMVDD